MSTRKSSRLSAAVETPPLIVAATTSATTTSAATKSRKRKATSDRPGTEHIDTTIPNRPTAPTTPAKKRTTKKAALPPATPTPSNVALMTEIVDVPSTSTPAPRLVDPDTTNASLISPLTSRTVRSQPKAVRTIDDTAVPASHTDGDTGTVTTQTLLATANAHLLSVDSRMKPLIDTHSPACHVFSPAGLAERLDPFESLTSGILSQQVSGAAAKAIKNRFIALFDHEEAAEATTTTPSRRFPTPQQVVAEKVEFLKSAGLSLRKAEYVKGLAEKFVSGELTTQILADAPYEEVLERLTAVRGLGKWSVEMFAMFGLKRMDVFSLGDLGIQRGMAAFLGRDVAKLKSKGAGNKWKYMSEKEMTELSDKFKPYRSLFCWYMWRVEETDISTME